jgi:hypothetical protein
MVEGEGPVAAHTVSNYLFKIYEKLGIRAASSWSFIPKHRT